MQRLKAVDSVVLQVSTDGADLCTAEKITALLGGKLEVLKCFPVQPTKEDQKSWRSKTGKPMLKSMTFTALIHHERGQSIPLLRYGASKGLEIHFHGLQQYEKKELVLHDGAIQRQAIMDEFIEQWKEPLKLARLDRSIDLVGMAWKGFTNSRDHRSLCKKQGSSVFKTSSIYYQSKKAQYVRIVSYDKQTKNKLEYPLTRIELSFKGQYWRTTEYTVASNILDIATTKTDAFIKRTFC